MVVARRQAERPESESLTRAYQACAALARSHYENFPVASWLLPRFMRPHVAAVYAFARVADDLADEGRDDPDTRRAQLRAWQQRLHATAAAPLVDAPDITRDDLIVLAVGHTIRSLELPVSLFDDLVSAFAQDITTDRYASWADLFDYCRRSANPVGRLVLLIAGYRQTDLTAASDALCTALQLTNFWQDLGPDWRVGRLYVPEEVRSRSGARVEDLSDGRWTDSWSAAIESCVGVTRRLFDEGRPVCEGVSGRLGLELKMTWHGGMRVLARVEACRARLLHHRPRVGPGDLPVLLWRTMFWTAGA